MAEAEDRESELKGKKFVRTSASPHLALASDVEVIAVEEPLGVRVIRAKHEHGVYTFGYHFFFELYEVQES